MKKKVPYSLGQETLPAGANKQVIELRARIAEREFQLAAKQKPDFQSVPEMISFIIREY